MAQKNILVLDTGKEWGGGTNSLLELLKRIDKSKYHFSVLFYNNYKKGNESNIKTEIENLGIDFLLLEQEGQHIASKILKESARTFFFFSAKLKRYFIFLIDYYFRILPNVKKIADILKRRNTSLLYMNNQPSSNLEGVIAAKDADIPCIQHSRIGAELNSIEVDAVNNWLTKMLCVSRGVKDMFVKQGVDASKCDVVYNGIASDVKPKISASDIRKQWGVGGDDILIGTVGSLIKRKRISDLIEGMARIQSKEARGDLSTNPPVSPFAKGGRKGGFKCMIVGDGPEKDNIQEQALKMGLQDKVIFTGFQSDAISYINAMDIFVLPSENEGLPRVILEAMLMAKPVVACDITGPSELIVDGETGFLVPVRNPELLADALSKLAASDDLRRGMGEKGRIRVIARFAIDKYVNDVNNIFEEVLG